MKKPELHHKFYRVMTLTFVSFIVFQFLWNDVRPVLDKRYCFNAFAKERQSTGDLYISNGDERMYKACLQKRGV